ncbi:hypothetical protein H2198_007074 [Neophaeococcomyces mojaviensis]|uniref:Uncharacterized protein n=1 Tax=Neophaeococcomyces mojaviensis TaxID=3383035 RepID=A0ACC3A122_9EURO|nr:hypothetical protein H2198_007074 [Knufia sp. JES_112]
MSEDQEWNLPNVTYGFIGIGVMGFPMAQNLRKRIPKSAQLVICEVVEAQVKKFLSETEPKDRVSVASTPKEIAEQCDIIITMLPKGPHVQEVFTNKSTGLLAGAPSSKSILFMECSTIDTLTSNKVNDLVTEAGHRFVDAPVSGGYNGAVAGTLTFMIGGSEELFNEVRPLAEAMGKKENIYHCGKQGAGLATKQINNYLGFVSMLGVSEAFNMGRLYGLNPKTLASVVNVSTGRCYNSSSENPVKGVTPTASASKDFEGGFSTELCQGVVEMALQLGEQVGAKSVLRDVVLKTLAEASEDPRCKGKDYRSIYLHLADIEQNENHV